MSQALVVQKVDSALHWIAQLVSLILDFWIAIYPVDSAIQRSNNRGQMCCISLISVVIGLCIVFSKSVLLKNAKRKQPKNKG